MIAACTATEVLVNTLFRVLWACLGRNVEKLEGVLNAPFKSQLTQLLPQFLSEELKLDDESLPSGRWYSDCYRLRNQIVHEGRKSTAGEAYDSKVATGNLARWIGEELLDDPRTNWIKRSLRFKAQR